MTHSSSVSTLRRASERVSAGAAAAAVTLLMLFTLDSQASEIRAHRHSLAVSYSPAALGSAAGAAEVYRKLKSAAQKVCGEVSGPRPLDKRAATQRCLDAALADAVRRIDQPRLTSLHAADSRNLG
jgi:UrcA family protein